MTKRKDYSQFYQELTGRIRESGAACFALRASGIGATGIMYGAYPALLVLLGVRGEGGQLLRTVLVPGLAFGAVSAARRIINRPRPYETWRIDPLIRKDTCGNSMPSRHVFSSAVIATAWFQVSPPAGAFLLAVGAAAALIRVLGGVHYPSDVAAGYLLGIAAGLAAAIR